jgi:hypothetical protein
MSTSDRKLGHRFDGAIATIYGAGMIYAGRLRLHLFSAIPIDNIFHEMLPSGRKPKKAQMPFSPNSGYAFAVADNTWHSTDKFGPEVQVRDSILLTYFVDAGRWRFLRNRGRRFQNFLLNEMRNLQLIHPQTPSLNSDLRI